MESMSGAFPAIEARGIARFFVAEWDMARWRKQRSPHAARGNAA
jgi:hypothetical protein